MHRLHIFCPDICTSTFVVYLLGCSPEPTRFVILCIYQRLMRAMRIFIERSSKNKILLRAVEVMFCDFRTHQQYLSLPFFLGLLALFYVAVFCLFANGAAINHSDSSFHLEMQSKSVIDSRFVSPLFEVCHLHNVSLEVNSSNIRAT